MNRREFANWLGVGALASSLPIAIAACQGDTADAPTDAPADTAATVEGDGFAAIGTVADLDAAGFLANVRFQGSRVLVIRDPANADAVIAFNAVCPHAACTVEWGEETLVCPCHDSFFNFDGTVASGPAAEPLAQFEAKIEGDQVLVKV
ncbi:QcrA and Rieske domain-containing protein [Leptolyngbya iicbica]|uniref:Rieske (2Fe-2S) protein n=2 Tax=Cyanophyceae TaxID=3028117 RepID=A0A4Q7E9Q5_9CYAN|nr:Rieske (2Fe-2S) protein [Leptolyngbya sp. LK]RZM79281.1 Rieske (2Fe-2S) protein [Leptolyngbya sp. LK]